MASDGSVFIDVNMNVSRAEKNFAKLIKQIEESTDKIAEMEAKIDTYISNGGKFSDKEVDKLMKQQGAIRVNIEAYEKLSNAYKQWLDLQKNPPAPSEPPKFTFNPEEEYRQYADYNTVQRGTGHQIGNGRVVPIETGKVAFDYDTAEIERKTFFEKFGEDVKNLFTGFQDIGTEIKQGIQSVGTFAETVMDASGDAIIRFGDGIRERAGNAVQSLRDKFSGLGEAVRGVASRAGSAILSGLTAPLKSVEKLIDKVAHRFTRMVANVFFFNVISKAMREISSYMSTVIDKNTEISTALAQLKGALYAMIQPLASMIIPILTQIINFVTSIIVGIGQLVATLTGMSWSDSVAGAKSVASSMGSGASSAKKMEKSLASFDQINQLGKDTGGGAKAPKFNFGDGVDFAKMFDKFKEITQGIVDAFKVGFEYAFDPSSIKPIIDGAKHIGQLLKEIFTDPSVVGSVDFFIRSVAGSLGGLTGLVATALTTLASLLVGGFEKFLVQSKESIISGFAEIFSLGGEIFWQIAEFFGNLSPLLAPFGGEIAQSILGNILSILWTAFSTIFSLGEQIALTLLNGVNAILLNNTAGIVEAINGILEPANMVLDAIRQKWEEICLLVQDSYVTYVEPALTDFMAGMDELAQAVIGAWNTYMNPVFKKIGEGITELVDGEVGTAIEKVIDLFGRVIQVLEMVWDVILKPIAKWIGVTLVSGIAGAVDEIWGIVKAVVAFLAEETGYIADTLSGLLQFVAGVFTGDWTSAWSGLVSAMKGILNGVVTAVESAVNTIIAGINNIGFDIPDWVPKVGGSHFGLSLGTVSLPRLASGAVIPANAPFLAMLGDQKQGTNIEAPLDTIVQAFRMALNEQGGGQQQAVLMVDRTVLGQLVYQLNKEESKRIGVDLVNA